MYFSAELSLCFRISTPLQITTACTSENYQKTCAANILAAATERILWLGSDLSLLTSSWLIDCMTSSIIIQPWNILFAPFLKD